MHFPNQIFIRTFPHISISPVVTLLLLPLRQAAGTQALDTQTRASFAEHEGKLHQQREALARQHQKGLTTLQSGIDSLKAKLASDAQQHAATVDELQDCNSALQRQKEQACSKGRRDALA